MNIKLNINTKEDLLKLINTFGIETVLKSMELKEQNINNWFQDYIGDILDLPNLKWNALISETNLLFDCDTMKYLIEKKNTSIYNILFYYNNNKIELPDYFRQIVDNFSKQEIQSMSISTRDYVYNTYTVIYKSTNPGRVCLVKNETDNLSEVDKQIVHNFISFFAEASIVSPSDSDYVYYTFPSEEIFVMVKEKLHNKIEEMQGNQFKNLEKLKDVFLRPSHSSSNLQFKSFKYILTNPNNLGKDLVVVEFTVEKTKKGKFVRNYIFNIQASKLKESYMEIKNQIHEKIKNLPHDKY